MSSNAPKGSILKKLNVNASNATFLKKLLVPFEVEKKSDGAFHFTNRTLERHKLINTYINLDTIDEQLIVFREIKTIADYEQQFDLFKNVYISASPKMNQMKYYASALNARTTNQILTDRHFLKMGLAFILLCAVSPDRRAELWGCVDDALDALDLKSIDCVHFWTSFLKDHGLEETPMFYVDRFKEDFLNVISTHRTYLKAKKKTFALAEVLLQSSDELHLCCPCTVLLPEDVKIANRTCRTVDLQMSYATYLSYYATHIMSFGDYFFPALTYFYRQKHWSMLYTAIKSIDDEINQRVLKIENVPSGMDRIETALTHLIEHKQWYGWSSYRTLSTLLAHVLVSVSSDEKSQYSIYINGELVMMETARVYLNRNGCTCDLTMDCRHFIDDETSFSMLLDTVLRPLEPKAPEIQFFCFAFLCYHAMYATFDETFGPDKTCKVICEDGIPPWIENALLKFP